MPSDLQLAISCLMERSPDMLRTLLRYSLLAAVSTVLFSTLASSAQAQTHGGPTECRPYEYGRPDLFANYYLPPTCGGVGAQMYVAPVPVPGWVGHTYYTYQPMMPNELLYKHHRTYHRYYNEGRGLTRTSVVWW
jgi:hypothetical protein